MTRIWSRLVLSAFFILPVLRALPQEAAPDFKEVYDLIKDHLAGMNGGELNRTAVQALVSALAPRVAIADAKSTSTSLAEQTLLSKSMLFDGPIAYLRVAKVEEGLAKALQQAFVQVSSTNRMSGLVLDLRYAVGDDYSAAAAVADLFLKKERPLIDWGKGPVHSKEKEDAITIPVALLVNRQTAGAAEALAAVLRDSGAALILGARTAGQAMIAQEYPLSNGARLRIAVSPIQVGEGVTLSADGVKPDIAIQIAAADERAYFADAYKDLSRTGSVSARTNSLTSSLDASTNRPRRPRLNEAELVRARRDGFNLDADTLSDTVADLETPAVRDPVLARALDVLKGLSVVRQSRP